MSINNIIGASIYVLDEGLIFEKKLKREAIIDRFFLDTNGKIKIVCKCEKYLKFSTYNKKIDFILNYDDYEKKWWFRY